MCRPMRVIGLNLMVSSILLAAGPGAGAAEAGAVPIPADGILLKRDFHAFLPAQGEWPALVAGGGLQGVGDAGYTESKSVDAIWADGRRRALPALTHPWAGTQVFRLADGALLTVGEADIGLPLPAQWLSVKHQLEGANWIDLDLGVDHKSAFGQLADGSLVAVDPAGTVERMVISAASTDKPILRKAFLPNMNRRRISASNRSDSVVLKGLPDGRIIVAGGQVQVDKVALLHEDSMQNDAPDEYVGVGEFLPWRRYEIYDPLTKTWRNSAPSRKAGGRAAIFTDGRVVKLSQSDGTGEGSEGHAPVKGGYLEISSASGDAWTAVKANEPPLVDFNGYVQVFVIQDELFLAGEGRATKNGAGPFLLQWFDASALRWETMWCSEAGAGHNFYAGRIIVRELRNGKRVVLPAEGT